MASLGGHGVAHRPRDGELHASQVQDGGVDLQAGGDLAHTVVEHGVARDPEDAVLLAVPTEREADDVTDERVAQRRAMAAGRGGDLDRPAARVPRAASPAMARARASCRRGAFAPEAVVMTTPAAGSSARPAGSRLSPWWSCVSRTASIGGRSAAAIAGPASLRDDVPQPKEYLRPGGSNVGSVSSRQPPISISAVGPPMCVMRMSLTRASARRHGARRRVSERPLQGVVGDLFPALLSGEKVCSALVFLDLGDRVRLVVLGVRPLDRSAA